MPLIVIKISMHNTNIVIYVINCNQNMCAYTDIVMYALNCNLNMCALCIIMICNAGH